MISDVSIFLIEKLYKFFIHYLVLTTNSISEGDLSNILRIVKEKGHLYILIIFGVFDIFSNKGSSRDSLALATQLLSLLVLSSFVRSLYSSIISDDASLERCEIFFNANPLVLWFFS